MNEMMNYIFSRLQLSDNSMRDVVNTLKKQSKVNKRVRIALLGVCVGLYVSNLSQLKQAALLNERIKKMEKEIEELKSLEGE